MHTNDELARKNFDVSQNSLQPTPNDQMTIASDSTVRTSYLVASAPPTSCGLLKREKCSSISFFVCCDSFAFDLEANSKNRFLVDSYIAPALNRHRNRRRRRRRGSPNRRRLNGSKARRICRFQAQRRSKRLMWSFSSYKERLVAR